MVVVGIEAPDTHPIQIERAEMARRRTCNAMDGAENRILGVWTYCDDSMGVSVDRGRGGEDVKNWGNNERLTPLLSSS